MSTWDYTDLNRATKNKYPALKIMGVLKIIQYKRPFEKNLILNRKGLVFSIHLRKIYNRLKPKLFPAT